MRILKFQSREDCEEADHVDPLRQFREKFHVPDDTVYMMGNSLGLCPRESQAALSRFILNEWAEQHIEAWSKSKWFISQSLTGNKLGKLIGAKNDETITAESTSVSIFKCLATSIAIQKIDNPSRRTIVLERDNFPTDNYIAEGLLRLIRSEGYEIRYFDDDNPLEKVVNNDTVAVLLSLVNYRTGYLYDMNSVTALVHQSNSLIIWDLCHATGAVPIDLNDADADFAIGCTYKYLNSGPGGPSFLWVNTKHHDRVWQPLTGWYSHLNPFNMDHKYTPAKGIKQFMTGCPHIIQSTVVNCSVDIFLQTDMETIREKSLELSDFFIESIEARCSSLKLITPKNHKHRGSHVSYEHENGLGISKYLREKKRIMCDYRHPRIIRFAITPLYLRFVDIWDAIEAVCDATENADFEPCSDTIDIS
jgi:kynureninase